MIDPRFENVIVIVLFANELLLSETTFLSFE